MALPPPSLTDPLPAYDYVVVGAGCEGSATAYQLARRGLRVLLLEQFSLPTTRGSSHGPSRIIRRAYNHLIYTEMMRDAFAEWAQLEGAENVKLYHQKGLIVTNSDPSQHRPIRRALTQHGIPYTDMTAADVNRKYGPVFHFPDPFAALFEPDAGILNADKCLQAFWNQIRKHGGTIQDEEKVLSVVVTKDRVSTHRVTLSTSRGRRYLARGVVFCLGPWAKESSLVTRDLKLDLPLNPQRINVYYWETKDPSVDHTALPCIIHVDQGALCYGMPPPDAAGLFKFCFHRGPSIQPERRDQPDATAWRQQLVHQVRAYLPGLKPEPSIVDSCIYTWTPDENFILDKHPTLSNVVIGAGFSGHGFKMSIVIGNILGDLVTGGNPAYDLTMFRMDRFDGSKKAKL